MRVNIWRFKRHQLPQNHTVFKISGTLPLICIRFFFKENIIKHLFKYMWYILYIMIKGKIKSLCIILA